MEFQEKTRIRLEHWIKHDQGHLEEYQEFALQLEEAGHTDSAQAVKAKADYTQKGLECLQKALNGLDQS